MAETADQVAERVASVRSRIEAAGRPVGEVTLVGVTKGFGADMVAALVGVGVVDLGENFAQTLLVKAAATAPHEPVRWHFLGPVQRNKVKALAPHVSLWQGVDRLAAGAEIAHRAPGAQVLAQVNLAGDPARPGCSWGNAPSLVDGLVDLGLSVRGVMGVAGRTDARAEFRSLARLASDLGLDEVSMGMSGDFEIAVQEGSTMIRIGTALLGARPGAAQVRR